MKAFLQKTINRLRAIWRLIQGKPVIFNVRFVTPIRVVMDEGGYIHNCIFDKRPYEQVLTILGRDEADRETLAAWTVPTGHAWPLHNDPDLQGKI
jgi:hypothetical protein